MPVDRADVRRVARPWRFVGLRRRHPAVRNLGERSRIARRRHFRPRFLDADLRTAPRGVLVRHETGNRNFDELRIAEMIVTVGKRKLQRLGHHVYVFGRIVPHGPEVAALEDVERHRQHRTLRPRAAGVQFDAVEACTNRRLKIHLEAGEVLVAHEAALFRDELRDLRRDIALVERVARGLQPGLAAFAVRLLFLVRHVLQCPAEIGLHEHFTHFRWASLGQKNFFARRPALVGRAVFLDELRHHRMHRKTVAREANRRGGDFAEGHGAELSERGEPCVGRGRDHAPLDPRRDLPAMLLHEVIGRDGLGPYAEPVDAVHLLVFRGVDDLRRDTAEIDLVGLEHADGDARRNPGVDSVAARFQNLESGMRRKIVPGGNHMPGAHDGRAAGSHRWSLLITEHSRNA